MIKFTKMFSLHIFFKIYRFPPTSKKKLLKLTFHAFFSYQIANPKKKTANLEKSPGYFALEFEQALVVVHGVGAIGQSDLRTAWSEAEAAPQHRLDALVAVDAAAVDARSRHAPGAAEPLLHRLHLARDALEYLLGVVVLEIEGALAARAFAARFETETPPFVRVAADEPGDFEISKLTNLDYCFKIFQLKM